MSRTLTTQQIDTFDQVVHQVYQNSGQLKGSTRVKSNVQAESHRFSVLGKGVAVERTTRQTPVTPAGLEWTDQTANLKPYIIAEYTDKFDDWETNIDERAELSESFGLAMGRRYDQVTLDAIDAATVTKTVGTDVGGAGTDLNVAKLRGAGSALAVDEADPGMGRRCCFVGSTVGKYSLLGETEIGSKDYNAVQSLVDGTIEHYLGFKFKWIGTRVEGGLPKPSTRTNYAYEMQAIGCAEGMPVQTDIDWISTHRSWLTVSEMTLGAVVIDTLGVVEISTTEA